MYAFIMKFIEVVGGIGQAFFNTSEYLQIFTVLSVGIFAILIIKNLIF